VALLIFLRFRGRALFSIGRLAATFYALDWTWLALACLLAYATYFGRALRWAVFLRPLRPHPGMWNLFKRPLSASPPLFCWAGRRVRPPLPDLGQRAGTFDIPTGRLVSGAHL
jgi:hypothetical protein